jgi:hypothetical protein
VDHRERELESGTEKIENFLELEEDNQEEEKGE